MIDDTHKMKRQPRNPIQQLITIIIKKVNFLLRKTKKQQQQIDKRFGEC